MQSNQSENLEFSPGPIVVGGGPVGMLTALRLSQLGVPTTLCEMNTETTRWPKMDHNSCHTMEIFRLMGFAEEYRSQPGAVPQLRDWDTIFFNTCGPMAKLVSTWHIPNNESYRARINSENDGSHPAEPGQRCSQIVLESFLKQKCINEPLITCHFGYKFLSLEEDDEGVTAVFLDPQNGKRAIRAAYLVGADGGQSRVRKSVGIELDGKPLPGAFFMVHFRSEALRNLSPFGKWWHAFGLHGGFIIDQDDRGTYTCHEPCAVDAEAIKELQDHPEKVPYRVLGGLGPPYNFEIDEILVANAWRPNFALAGSYVSREGMGRVLLGGDAAHRNPPHGGYGMNSGVEDAVSIAWRLSALHKGFGGKYLLTSYTNERRPNMMMRLERCDIHIGKFTPMIMATMTTPDKHIFLEHSTKGDKAREIIQTHLDSVGPENIDRGVELDLRYLNSEVIVTDGSLEPSFNPGKYTPSTRPGHRAPHVFLEGSTQSILDLYGSEWTFVDLSKIPNELEGNTLPIDEGQEAAVRVFKRVAVDMRMPLSFVSIDAKEKHLKRVWQNYDFVLVRPDGYVAWRGGKDCAEDMVHDLNEDRVRKILRIVLGWNIDPGFAGEPKKALKLANNLTSLHGVQEELGTGEN